MMKTTICERRSTSTIIATITSTTTTAMTTTTWTIETMTKTMIFTLKQQQHQQQRACRRHSHHQEQLLLLLLTKTSIQPDLVKHQPHQQRLRLGLRRRRQHRRRFLSTFSFPEIDEKKSGCWDRTRNKQVSDFVERDIGKKIPTPVCAMQRKQK